MSFFPNLPLLTLALVLAVVATIAVVKTRHTDSSAAAVRRLVVAVLLIVIAARPMIGSAMVVSYDAGVDVVFVIDRTTSMAAEDYDGSKPRLAGVRDDVFKLVSSVNGSRFAVIVFDNEARTVLPFTTDAMAVTSLVDAIGWREADYGSGTDVAAPVTVAKELVERSRTERPEVGRYLVYIGDGEQTAGSEPASFSELAPLLAGGLVLGYGSTTGGPMKTHQGSDEYVKYAGQVALSRIDHANLQRIAESLRVDYKHRNAPSDLELKVSGEVLVPTERRDPRGFEIYWIVAGLVAVVLAFELWDSIGRFRRSKEDLR